MSFRIRIIAVVLAVKSKKPYISIKKNEELQCFSIMSGIDDFFHYLYTINYNIMEDINRLKVVLVEKKRTSKWLAEQLGVNPTTVSKWCTNSSQPDLGNLLRIADLLEVDIKELFVREYKQYLLLQELSMK